MLGEASGASSQSDDDTNSDGEGDRWCETAAAMSKVPSKSVRRCCRGVAWRDVRTPVSHRSPPPLAMPHRGVWPTPLHKHEGGEKTVGRRTSGFTCHVCRCHSVRTPRWSDGKSPSATADPPNTRADTARYTGTALPWTYTRSKRAGAYASEG